MLGEIADVNWGDTHTTKQSYSTTGFTAYSASGPDGLLPYADYDRIMGIVLSAIGADCGKTWLAKGKWSCIKNTIRLFAKEDDVDTEFLYWATRDSGTIGRREVRHNRSFPREMRELVSSDSPLSQNSGPLRGCCGRSMTVSS